LASQPLFAAEIIKMQQCWKLPDPTPIMAANPPTVVTMATFTLFITQSPFTTHAHYQAMDFARAATEGGHIIKRVFFYRDGVYCASNRQTPIQGQPRISELWAETARECNFPMQTCIANSVRRGLLDAAEATRYEQPDATLAEGFELAGLGEMAEAMSDSDRIIEF
jgi:tRNA 2-thiouridine synthesizing protein D